MGKAHFGKPKQQGGISLIPELWEAIDRAAGQAGVPRNRVMETILMREFCISTNFQKTSIKSRSMQEAVDQITVEDIGDD